jgi:hypothetical protein
MGTQDEQERRRTADKELNDLTHKVNGLTAALNGYRTAIEKRVEIQMHKRTKGLRIAAFFFTVALVLNVGALGYVFNDNRERAIALEQAFLVACDQRKAMENTILLIFTDLAAAREDDEPGDFEERQVLLERVEDRLSTPPCADQIPS